MSPYQQIFFFLQLNTIINEDVSWEGIQGKINKIEKNEFPHPLTILLYYTILYYTILYYDK